MEVGLGFLALFVIGVVIFAVAQRWLAGDQRTPGSSEEGTVLNREMDEKMRGVFTGLAQNLPFLGAQPGVTIAPPPELSMVDYSAPNRVHLSREDDYGLFSEPLELVGFALRHGQWARSNKPGPLAPFLIRPGEHAAIPDILFYAGDVATNLARLEQERDASAGTAQFTVLVAEAVFGETDAFRVQWTWRSGGRVTEGFVFARWRLDNRGYVFYLDVLEPAERNKEGVGLQALGDRENQALAIGGQVHRDTIEAVVPGFSD